MQRKEKDERKLKLCPGTMDCAVEPQSRLLMYLDSCGQHSAPSLVSSSLRVCSFLRRLMILFSKVLGSSTTESRLIWNYLMAWSKIFHIFQISGWNAISKGLGLSLTWAVGIYQLCRSLLGDGFRNKLTQRRSALGFLWREWWWSWNFSTLATSWEELTHWKRLWCWEGSGAGGEGDDRGWDGWMASRTRWTWVWVNSGSWWWTGRPGVLWFMGLQRVGHDWATELNWTEIWSWNSSLRK